MTMTGIGCALLITGVLMYEFMPTIIESIVKDKLILAKDSYTYDMWRKIPIPIYLSFYLFNTTNHEQVLKYGSDLQLQEVGPYTFLEKREKENITFHENGTVSYQQRRNWHFVKEKSNGSLSDLIVHLNVAVVSLGDKAKHVGGKPFFNYTLSTVCPKTPDKNSAVDCSFFRKHSVSQLLFDGYDDPFVDMAATLLSLPFHKFAYFYNRNNSASDGIYSIFTGKSDTNKLGLMDSWNKQKNLSKYWFGEQCDRIDLSSGGDFQPPYKLTKSNGPIYMFVGDICRSIKFNYYKDIDVNGIKCKRYVADQSLFDYSLKENKCFCDQIFGCPANGVADVSSCTYGAPAFVSFPHFLYADRSYSKFIQGLKPSEDKHKFFMDIEPTFGIPINAKARIQINVLFEKVDGIDLFSNLKHEQLFLPQLWTSISAEIDSEMSDKLKLILNTVPLIDDILSFVLMSFGVLLFILVLFLSHFTTSQKYSVKK
jgi:hypothetical protein